MLQGFQQLCGFVRDIPFLLVFRIYTDTLILELSNVLLRHHILYRRLPLSNTSIALHRLH